MQAGATGEAGTVAAPGSDASAPARSGRASPPAWPGLLAGAIRDLDELWRVLALPGAPDPAQRAAAAGFPLLVPRGFAARMRPGDPADPLLAQVLPASAELLTVPGFGPDPVGERHCELVPGLLRKYAGRALLVTTGACAVNCRFCFRRAYPYDGLPRGDGWWRPALAAIAADPSIEELILSGGDPLTLPDAQLARLADEAAAIPHLARLRLHTRLPVVLPERLDRQLAAWLGACRPQPVLVIHANHPAELDATVAAGLARLRAAVPRLLLLNQAVLLAGVNDDAAVLAALSRRLGAIGVLPYYLHQLDRVAGAAHFAVADDRARDLHARLVGELPGYLVPRLVRETAGAPGKTAL